MEVAVSEKLDDVQAAPTDDQAAAFLNGDRQAVELQQQKPQEEKAAPAVAAPSAPDQSKSEVEQLKQELNRIKSEFGQFRKRGLESPKPQEQKPTPQALAAMSPEEQQRWMELFEHSFEQKYGRDFADIKTYREQQETQARISGIETYARTLTGDLHDKLDPIMGRIYAELREKAEQGDEEASMDLEEIKTTRSGIRDLVARARQEYSQSIEAKGSEAQAKQQAVAKKASVTLGPSAQPVAQPDILKNLPDDPAEAAAMLKKELQKRGAL